MPEPRKRDFEIHVGFPDRDEAKAESLRNSEAGWKVSLVRQVVDGDAPPDIEDAHDVEELRALATYRVEHPEEARTKIDDVAARFGSAPGVRIEAEEVLLTQVGEGHNELVVPDGYVPDQTDFQHALLIPQTPPFEMHLGVQRTDRAAFPYEVSDLMGIAKVWQVPIHQAVRFESKEKVTFTTFFRTFEDMASSVHVYGDRYRTALRRFDPNLELKLVAERIVLCARPSEE